MPEEIPTSSGESDQWAVYLHRMFPDMSLPDCKLGGRRILRTLTYSVSTVSMSNLSVKARLSQMLASLDGFKPGFGSIFRGGKDE